MHIIHIAHCTAQRRASFLRQITGRRVIKLIKHAAVPVNNAAITMIFLQLEYAGYAHNLI